MVPGKSLGLDFGTTNCRIAFISFATLPGDRRDPQLVEFQGIPSLRSMLLLDETGSHVLRFGKAVLEPTITQHAATRVKHGFRMQLGQDVESVRWAHLLLAEAYRAALSVLSETVLARSQIHVGVEATRSSDTAFTDALREAILLAGFPEPSFVPVPLAATAYHAERGDLGKAISSGHYLVVHCGGVYTELSVVMVPEDDAMPRVIASCLERYGGQDYDRALARYLLSRYGQGNVGKVDELALLSFIEGFKEAFSKRVKTGGRGYRRFCKLPGIESEVSLSQEEFECPDVAGELIERFPLLAEKTLREAGVGPSQIEQSILAGGSAHWYFLEQAMERILPGSIVVAGRPEETAVKGLALWPLVRERLYQRPRPEPEAEAVPTVEVIEPGAVPGRPAPGRTFEPERERPPGRPAPLSPQPPQIPKPKHVFGLEMFGLLGFLGIGWLVSGRLGIGILALLSWWAILVGGTVALIALAIAEEAPWVLLGMVLLWLVGPTLSGLLAARGARRRWREWELGERGNRRNR